MSGTKETNTGGKEKKSCNISVQKSTSSTQTQDSSLSKNKLISSTEEQGGLSVCTTDNKDGDTDNNS